MIDTDLLRKQIQFLLDYPWRDRMPLEVEGIVNMLESILDQQEGVSP